jgi:hypothetical protein
MGYLPLANETNALRDMWHLGHAATKTPRKSQTMLARLGTSDILT